MLQVRGAEEEEVQLPSAAAAGGPRSSAQQAPTQEALTAALSSHRLLPLGFVEVEESGMSEVAAMCKESGLERLFLTALKL